MKRFVIACVGCVAVAAGAAIAPTAAAAATQAGSSPPAAVGAEGGNGQLYVQAPQLAAGWHSLGGQIVGPPAVAAAPNTGNPVFIATGSNGELWMRSLSAGWTPVGPSRAFCIGSPAAVVTSDGTLTVACEGLNRALFYTTTTLPSSGLPSFSNGWTSLGGVLSAGPAVTPVGGTVTFFVRGSNGQVFTRTTSAGFAATPWFCNGAPAAGTGATTGIATFACQGGDRSLWTATNSGAGWSSAHSVGGQLAGGPGVAAAGGVTGIFAEGTDGTVWEWTAASGWASIGGRVIGGVGAVALSLNWTTYLQGSDRTGFAASENGFTPASVPNLHLAWQASDAGPSHGVFSQPVVSNGLIYWGSFDGNERATDTSGNLVWQTNLGTTTPPASDSCFPLEAGVASTPTITTDIPVGSATSVLYVGGGDSKVYALNAASGAVLWSYSVGGNPDTFIWSSPAVFGGSVYIGVSSFGDCPLVQGQLLQLNRVTGALQNTFNTVPNGCVGGGVWGSPTVDAAAGTIYFDTGNPGGCSSSLAPALVEVNASDLSLVGSWVVPTAQQGGDSDFGATPTLFSGVIGGQSQRLVGVVNKNGLFYAFKRGALPSGPVWSTRIAAGGEDPSTGSGDVASAAFDGTALYVGGDATTSCSGSINALNPSTGAFIWQHCFTDGGFPLGGVTVSSGGVVAVGEGSNIAAFSAATGASLFTYAGAGLFWGPPSIVDGTLYEGDMAGNLYALTPG